MLSFCSVDSETCDFDKLVVSDESDSDTQCGGGADQLPPLIEKKGREVKFSFTTDSSTTSTGFQLEYNITRLEEGEIPIFKRVLLERFVCDLSCVARACMAKHTSSTLAGRLLRA